MERFTVKTPDAFTEIIDVILSQPVVDDTMIIALSGDLGAGKTTFVQQLARHLGVAEKVVSPTFGIMRAYAIEHPQFDQLVHIDAYRIEDISETGPLRLVELFSLPRTLICIEWPERIESILPKSAIQVAITIAVDDVRTVTVGQ